MSHRPLRPLVYYTTFLSNSKAYLSRPRFRTEAGFDPSVSNWGEDTDKGVDILSRLPSRRGRIKFRHISFGKRVVLRVCFPVKIKGRERSWWRWELIRISTKHGLISGRIRPYPWERPRPERWVASDVDQVNRITRRVVAQVVLGTTSAKETGNKSRRRRVSPGSRLEETTSPGLTTVIRVHSPTSVSFPTSLGSVRTVHLAGSDGSGSGTRGQPRTGGDRLGGGEGDPGRIRGDEMGIGVGLGSLPPTRFRTTWWKVR